MRNVRYELQVGPYKRVSGHETLRDALELLQRYKARGAAVVMDGLRRVASFPCKPEHQYIIMPDMGAGEEERAVIAEFVGVHVAPENQPFPPLEWLIRTGQIR